VDRRNNSYAQRDGVLFNKDFTVLVKYPEGNETTEYSIPKGVTVIGSTAFAYSGLKFVTIPPGVINISERAFYECDNLISVSIPDGVTNIGASSFAFCRSLKSITMTSSVISIGNDAFYNCNDLTSITIPGGIASIAFGGCLNLTSIDIEVGGGNTASSGPVTITLYVRNPPAVRILWSSRDETPGVIHEPFSVVYVPPSSVEAYKSAPGWKNYGDRITPIIDDRRVRLPPIYEEDYFLPTRRSYYRFEIITDDLPGE
jgi:hypothetical protein